MTCGFVTCDLAVAAQERDNDPKSADHLRKYAKVFRNSPHFKFRVHGFHVCVVGAWHRTAPLRHVRGSQCPRCPCRRTFGPAAEALGWKARPWMSAACSKDSLCSARVFYTCGPAVGPGLRGGDLHSNPRRLEPAPPPAHVL